MRRNTETVKKLLAGAALAVLLEAFLFVAFLAVPVQRLYDRCHETGLRYQELLRATVPVFDAEQVDKIVVNQSKDPDFPAEWTIQDPEEIAAICAIWARASAEEPFEVLGTGKEPVVVLQGGSHCLHIYYQNGVYAGRIWWSGIAAPLDDPHRTRYAAVSPEQLWNMEPDEGFIPERYRSSPTLHYAIHSGEASALCYFAITSEENARLDAITFAKIRNGES